MTPKSILAAAAAFALATTATRATQGAARAGKQCVWGGNLKSVVIGMPIDFGPDKPGANGNEVNNVYYIGFATAGAAKGSMAGSLGFFAFTFNNETWYQPPIETPGYGALVNIGPVTIAPNEPFTRAWLDRIDRALRSSSNARISKPARDAVAKFLRDSRPLVRQPGSPVTSTITPCFDGPWNGNSAS